MISYRLYHTLISAYKPLLLSFVVNNNITTHKAIYYSLLFISELKEEGLPGDFFLSRDEGEGCGQGLVRHGC